MKHLKILWILLVTGFFYLLMFFVGTYVLIDRVVPNKGITIEKWLNLFMASTLILIVIALLFSLLWYIVSSFLSVTKYTETNKLRSIWVLLFISVSIINFVLAFNFLPLPLPPSQKLS
jgi:hypothetical protein